METPAGTYDLGPKSGHIHLRTGREGMAAKVGHDLVIDLPSWSGTLAIDPADPPAASLAVEIDLTALTVLSGTGGVTELTDKDKTDIAKNAAKSLEVGQYPTVQFRVPEMPVTAAGGQFAGTLTMHGVTAPLELQISAAGDSHWRATGEVLQSTFGIKPYRGLMGALRLADAVALDIEIHLEKA